MNSAMTPIRVLIVDDSVVIRKALCDVLAGDADLVVAGTASDGKIALSRIPQFQPDIITLDIEMPVMNGLETLVELRKLYPKLPVIMFSTLTGPGATATLEALARGASDYATKPSNGGNLNDSILAVRNELIPKIKALCRGASMMAGSIPTPELPPRKGKSRRIEIVAIGTSTGGPNALAEVIPRLPKDFPVPVVVVQHMPPIFTRLLAERLANRSAISVEEGKSGAILSPGHSWIAPGNFHMIVQGTSVNLKLQLNQDPPEHSCRPAVDVLFRSVAAVYRSGTLGVVLTGMGSDGLIGARQIRDAGGEVIIQDQESAVVWGMPGLVYANGQADAVYPLDHLASEITRRVMQGRTSQVGTLHVTGAAQPGLK